MPLKSDSQNWGSVAKLFHWLVVLLILVQGVIGLIMVDLPKKPTIIPIYNFHKSIGITILALAVLRLLWRAVDPRPQEPAGMPRWQTLGARAGHALLYLLLFLVPLSGWWFDSVSALRPMYWFGLVQMPHLGGPDPTIPDLKEIARSRHEALFWVLVVVAAGHAAMAFFHQFVNRDGTLARMLPGRRRLATAPLESLSGASATESPDATLENHHVESPLADSGTSADSAPRNPGS